MGAPAATGFAVNRLLRFKPDMHELTCVLRVVTYGEHGRHPGLEGRVLLQALFLRVGCDADPVDKMSTVDADRAVLDNGHVLVCD